MSIIEGIGDEVTNFFIILITSVILYLAWASTHVRDERISRAALLIIETNRRRFNNPRDPVNQRTNLRNGNFTIHLLLLHIIFFLIPII